MFMSFVAFVKNDRTLGILGHFLERLFKQSKIIVDRQMANTWVS